ncbi:DUF4233 domain-containing protein [Epidermidibacterium keratini]|uniref:DUF4233 domain-containing protein n=1 Tax=Epidermidibacterium keratini TaxID=1891644 RepID=A0A7L4YJT8_9ACTN|nr:DUF4233 domain-containing protein [Epidermidibacterium keratini]QHB99379.1 DUF4233 domain-containing protein [Epidermidibacterium keratini]
MTDVSGAGASEPRGLPPVDKVRLEKSMRGIYSVLLILEAVVVLLVPATISRIGVGLTGFRLAAILVVIAGLIALCAFITKPWAYAAGWVLQVAVFLLGFFTWAMFVLGVIFGGLWLAAGRLHRDLRARPSL